MITPPAIVMNKDNLNIGPPLMSRLSRSLDPERILENDDHSMLKSGNIN
jgi:hypothetical protein